MRVALIQFPSSSDLNDNLDRMKVAFEKAVSEKARLVVFPEMAYLTGKRETWQPVVPKYSELLEIFSGWAKRHQVYLMPGTLREPDAANLQKYFNTLPVIGPDGSLLESYRKIFLFRANLPHKVYEEAKDCSAGDEVKSVMIDGHRVGLAICYDLRFPELFRVLKKQGSELVVLPAAFTVPTGEAHWEVLVRARAIENQFYLAGVGLVGKTGEGVETYGHSAAFGPWGDSIGALGADSILYFDFDSSTLKKAAEKVDSWGSRREELFPFT